MYKKGILPIIGMVLVWSGYYLSSKYLVTITGSPYLTGMLLRGAAFIIYTIILLASGEFKDLFRTRETWYILLIIGVLGFVLDTAANIGFKYSSASSGTVLLKLDILMVNSVTAFILKKRLSTLEWLLSLMMLVGVIMVLNIDFATLKFNVYDLFFILSAAAITANAFIIKWVQRKHSVKSNVIGYYNNLTVFILFAITTLISGDINGVASSFAESKLIFIMLVGGAMQCMIYIFYYYNLRKFEVWIVKIFLLFVPVATSIAAIALFKERLAPMTIAGMCVVLIGAFGILYSQSRKKGEIK